MLALYRGLLLIVALLTATAKEEPFAPVGAAYGYDSSVTQSQVSLAKDQAAWDRLWAIHRGTSGAKLPGSIQLADDRPSVDFKKNVVIGVFGGTMQEIEGYAVEEALTDGKTAFVRFVPVPPELRADVPRVTQPYGFVILPRTKLPLEVQIPAGRDKWRTVAKFDPTLEASTKKKG